MTQRNGSLGTAVVGGLIVGYPGQLGTTIITDSIASGLPSDWTQENGTFTAQIVADNTTSYTDRILNTSADSVSGEISWNPPGINFDQEALVLAKITGPVGVTISYEIAIIRRQAGSSDSQYSVSLVSDSSGTGGPSYAITRIIAGGGISLTTGSFVWSTGQWYWARIRVSGSTLSAKVWALGTAEPGAFGLTTSDSTYISGKAGVRLFTVGANVAVFSVGTNGAVAPLPPQLAQGTLAGSGGLSVNALVQSPAVVTFGGLGALNVTVGAKLVSAATLGGSGGLSVNVQQQSAVAQAGQSESNIFVINYYWPSAPPQFRYLYVQAPALDTVSIWAGQATFAGAGGLSASAKLGEAAAATLQGSGSLSVAATQAMAAQASFAGAGTLSADVRQAKSVAATFSGTGSLSAAAGQGMAVSAQFAGVGGLSAYANLRMVVAATFGGTGTLRVDAVITGAAAQAETNTSFLGVFTPTTYQLFAGLRQAADAFTPTAWPAQAIFAGAGSLRSFVSNLREDIPAESNIFVINYYWPVAPIATRYNLYLQPARDVVAAGPTTWAGQATFAGAGTLSALTTQQMAVLAALQGAGTLRVDAQNAKPVTATFAGAGSLAAYVTSQMVASAIFGGVGSLSVDARVAGATNQWSGQATFAGAGGLIITANLIEVGAATLQGAGSLAAFANLRMGAAATFSGLGSFSIDVQKLAESVAATFNGTGGLSARAQVALAASANFGGVGTLSVAMRAAYAASVAFTGTGVMLTTVTQRNVAAAIFNGAGSLSADVQRTVFGATAWPGQARFSGQGRLSVDTNVVRLPPGPTYDFPIEHALDSDYGIRNSKRRRGRLVIGRR